MKNFGLKLLVALALSGTAHGGMVVTFTGTTQELGLGLAEMWHYEITVDSQDSVVGSSSYFTIQDFLGFADAYVAPIDWAFTSTQDGPPDVTFTYTGSGLSGPFTLGGFGIASSGNIEKVGNDLWRLTNTGTNLPYDGGGTLIVPDFIDPPVPEPASLFLAAGALIFLGAAQRRRQQ